MLTEFARRRYTFWCTLAADEFMSWKAGDLRTIELGQWRKRCRAEAYDIVFASYDVPAPYDRLVSQLITERVHADHHDTYEARRRAVYAMATLDAFGDELKEFKNSKLPTASFRSKVLTPILQRQRLGIHDAYTPFVSACVASDGKTPTLRDISKTYLGCDPANPSYIRAYRRNLLYLPDPRWHLGMVMHAAGRTQDEQNSSHKRVRVNHDKIMATPLAEVHMDCDQHGIPRLSCTEIEVIFDEGLEDFFAEELQSVVRSFHSLHCRHLTIRSHSLRG